MFINFWYAVDFSERVTDQPAKVRMLGLDFVKDLVGANGWPPVGMKRFFDPSRGHVGMSSS